MSEIVGTLIFAFIIIAVPVALVSIDHIITERRARRRREFWNGVGK